MSKISKSFDIREFVPKAIWLRFGEESTMYINPEIIKIAEFYKEFFTTYYANKHGDDLKSVAIVVNNWLWGGIKQYSGFRPRGYTKCAGLSQHYLGNAFDCEIILVFKNGRREEVSYKEIHRIIKQYEDTFFDMGVRRIESLVYAPGWLHTDIAWLPNRTKIWFVGA